MGRQGPRSFTILAWEGPESPEPAGLAGDRGLEMRELPVGGLDCLGGLDCPGGHRARAGKHHHDLAEIIGPAPASSHLRPSFCPVISEWLPSPFPLSSPCHTQTYD